MYFLLFWFEYNNTFKLYSELFFYSKRISYIMVALCKCYFPTIVLKVPNVAVHQLKQILEKASQLKD